MRRRDFIKAIISSAAGWPCVALAQTSEGMRRIAVLIGVADDPEGRARLVAFREGMKSLGWIEGRNIHFEVRFAEGRAELSRTYAAEIVALSPDLIVASGTAVIRALQQLTKTIPIVFAQVVDPVSSGYVESLARPGGNMTGFTSVDYSIGTKWLETLKEIAPKVNTPLTKPPSVIDVAMLGTSEMARDYVAAFHRSLADGGFVEGRNVGIEYRW